MTDYENKHEIDALSAELSQAKNEIVQLKAFLSSSEKGFDLLSRAMNEGVCLHELLYDENGEPVDYEIIDVNPAYENITGISRESALNQKASIVYRTCPPPFLDVYSRVTRTGQPETFEALWAPMGKQFLISVFSPLEGQFATIFTDITAKSQFEKAVWESRERFQKIFNSHLDAIFVLSAEKQSKVIECNRAACEIFGYELHEMIGQSIEMLLADKSQMPVLRKSLLDAVADEGYLKNYQFMLKKKSGVVFPAEHSIVELTSDQGEPAGWLTIVRDLTEQREIDMRLRQAQKMEAIGNLAAGIAHDFNNILFPIVGMSELLLEDLSPGSIEYENAKTILKAGKRGRELVKQILAFSRQADNKMVPTRIQQILKDVLKLIRSTIPADIELSQKIQNDCGPVMAEPTQIHQTIMNLVTNAYHAVENNRGRISIQLQEVSLDSNESNQLSISPGRYAMLTVADTGCGIDAAVMEKIFEPYFTTKEQGKGTGIGLAVVYGIIKEHKGSIKFTSEPGSGTEAYVYLPLMDKNSAELSMAGPEENERGNERILLVDDEESIAQMVEQILVRKGYQVAACTESMAAVELFSENPYTFDLVITDMTMPGMSGDMLAKAMMSIRPEIPIIMCTGFSERMNKDRAFEMGIKGYLMKPIVRSELLQMIRNTLDGQQKMS